MLNGMLGLFFCIVGILGVILPWSSSIQTALINFIFDNSLFLPFFGLTFILIGLSILIYNWKQSRNHYISIKIGPHSTLIDESLVRQYLEIYWKKHFPNQTILPQIEVKKNHLKIQVELPFLPLQEQKSYLEKVQEDLENIFIHLLGYHQPVQLFISFKEESSLIS